MSAASLVFTAFERRWRIAEVDLLRRQVEGAEREREERKRAEVMAAHGGSAEDRPTASTNECKDQRARTTVGSAQVYALVVAFRDAFTILHSADVTRLAAFYVERLGFDRGYRWPDQGEPVFLVVTLGAFSIGLTKIDALAAAGRVAFWLYTEDVDQEVERLRHNSVEVVAEPADTEWGERMATVSDPDGNQVHIGQRT